MPTRLALATWLSVGVVLGSHAPLFAQFPPEQPLTLGGGRVTLGGDLSGTVSCSTAGRANEMDASWCGADTGYFNYGDYEHSVLRLFRADLSASVALGRRFTALGELRSENGDVPRVYALYLRWTPWVGRRFSVQAGRVPPVFGTFARRAYPTDNPLIGYPLAYQYLTSVRADATPATAAELLRMRGRGWLSAFSLGSSTPARGTPLVSAFSWDTGVQAHVGTDRVEGAVAVTTGTLGNPLVRDDNAAKQVSARFMVKPAFGLVLGLSASRGRFVSDGARLAAGWPRDSRLDQIAYGADAEYSRDHYLIRGEAIHSRWQMPIGPPRHSGIDVPATALSIEGRYKIGPALYLAARLDRLRFGLIANTAIPWEAPVTRVEVGGGYAIRRNVTVKASFQHNERDTTYVPRLRFLSAQIVTWF